MKLERRFRSLRAVNNERLKEGGANREAIQKQGLGGKGNCGSGGTTDKECDKHEQYKGRIESKNEKWRRVLHGGEVAKCLTPWMSRLKASNDG